MSETIRRILPRPIFNLLKSIKYRLTYGGLTHREVFEKIFAENRWRNDESVSGAGSTVLVTVVLREELAKFTLRENITTFVDVPCGDFNWMRFTSFPETMKYFGFDIVSGLIQRNQKMFSSSNRTFAICDILTDKLPPADVYFCKDLFIHFPNDAIVRASSRILIACKFFLATTFPNTKENVDINFGDARRVNMALILGEPLEMLKDFGDGVEDRYIGIWPGALAQK